MSAISITYHLLLVPPTTIFAARVNQASFSADTAQVTFDSVTTGAYTDIQPEMMILFGTSAGEDDRGRARVRKAATSNTLYFGWASRAVGEGEAYLEDDLYITVIDLYKPWTKNPRITPTGVSYTDYDRDFATYGDLPPVILLACGPAVQQALDAVTNKATFAFDASGSYVTDAHAGLISTWAWTLPSGATLTAGALDSDTVTFTLAQGKGWLGVVATDDNGVSTTRRVLCVAGEPSGTLSAFDQIDITRRPEGQTLRVRVSESIPKNTYPNGCMAVLWKRQTVDGVVSTPSGLSGHEHLCFVGWHYQDDTSGRADERGWLDDTVLDFLDCGGWAQTLPGYPILIERRTVPKSWTAMYHAHMDRYFMRLLAEYSNLLGVTDFSWSGLGETYYPFPALNSEGSTLYEQIDQRAQAIAHKFTCDQWGRLGTKPDPQRLDDTGGTDTPITRTTTVQKALTEAEWSDIRLSALPFPRVNWLRSSAIVAEALNVSQISRIKAVACTAPGNAPGQGMNALTLGEQLVTDQAELNARAGNDYARQNNPLPSIDITLATPDDFAIQPAYMEWVTFTNSSETAGQRQRTYSATRFLPIEVTISHDAERGTQTVIVRAEEEVSGKPAKTYVPPPDDSNPEIPDLPPPDWTPDGNDIGNLVGGLQNIFLIHASGEVSITSDFQTPSAAGGPTYTVVDLSLDGTALDAAGDPYSPKYLGTGDGVNCWIITTTSIYYVEDICDAGGSRTVNLQHTFAAETDYRTFGGERGVQNWMIVSSYYLSGGTKACYTTDGENWTEVTVTSNVWNHEESPPSDFSRYSSACEWYCGNGCGGWAAVDEFTWGADYTFNRPGDGKLGTYCKGSWSYTAPETHVNPTFALTVRFNGDLTQYKDCDDTVTAFIAIETSSSYPGSWSQNWRLESSVVTLDSGTNCAKSWSNVDLNISGAVNESVLSFRVFAKCVCGDITYGDLSIEVLECTVNGEVVYSTGGGYVPIPTPTVHVSGKVAGLAYVGAINAGSEGDLYASTDYGATWAQSSTLGHDYVDCLGGAFMFPWHDNPSDTIYYWGQYDGAFSAFMAVATTPADITPATGYGPNDPKCWGSCAQNRLVTALMAYNGTNIIGYRSEDGGLNWTVISSAVGRASAYVGVAIGDDPAVMWFWGPAGAAYSDTGGTTIDDRAGDASSSEAILLGGW